MSKNIPGKNPSQIAEKDITLPFSVGKILAIAPLLVVGLIMLGIYFSGLIQLMMANRELREYEHEAKAIEYLNWALSANPRLADAYAQRASSLLALEKQKTVAADYSAARRDIEQALKIDPKNYQYYKTSLEVEHAAHNYRKELDGYAHLFELDKDSQESKYDDRANLNYLVGDFKNERADRERSVKYDTDQLNDRDISIWLSDRGTQYRYLNQIDKAIRDYETCVKQERDDANLLPLAYLYEHSGRPSQALNIYNKIIDDVHGKDKTKPQESSLEADSARSRRANLYLKLGENEKALADAEFLRSDEDACVHRKAFRAKILDLLGRRADATAERKAAVETCSENINDMVQNSDAKAKADAYATRADFYESDQQWKNALTDYRVALSIEPNSWRHTECARMYAKLGDYDNAINFFSKAISPQSSDIDLERAYTGLAEVHLLQNKPTLAIEDCNKAIAENGHVDGEAIAWRAKAYRQAGKNALAEIDENEALGLEFSPLPDI
ncbi:hypothetical protein BH10CYA1_BH10CYA1_17400 [soil metagenome]